MFFLNKFFTMTDRSLTRRQKQKEKIRLKSLYSYYSGKLEYLANKKTSPQLVLITCKDAPVNRQSFTGKSAEQNYIKACQKFYQEKLKELNAGIKKVS